MTVALLAIVLNILTGKSMVLDMELSEYLMFRRIMDNIQYFQPSQSQIRFGDILVAFCKFVPLPFLCGVHHPASGCG